MPTYRVGNNSRTVVQVWGQQSGGWANDADLTSGWDVPDTVSQPPPEWNFPQKLITFGGAPLKRQTFDNGTEGVTVDAANSASSGDAISVVTVTGTGDAVYSASAGVRGGMGCRVTAPVATDQYTMALTGLSHPAATAQIYFRADSARYPTGASAVIGRMRSTSVHVAGVVHTTGGVFQLQNSPGSTLKNFNGNVALPDGMYWFDLRVSIGTSSSTGTINCLLFNADTGELIDSYYANNVDAGTANITNFQFGKPLGSGIVDMDIDEPAFSTGTTEQIFPIPLPDLQDLFGTADLDVTTDITADGLLTASTSTDEDLSVGTTASGVVVVNSSAAEDVTVTITATGGLAGQFTGTADRTVSVGITSSGALAGQADRATSVGITASGALVGQATRASTVNITASSALAGQADRAQTVTISGSGALAGQATRTQTVTITATSVTVGQADRAGTATITANGVLASQAVEAVTVGVTASGVVSLATSASQTITATISASGMVVGAPSGTATVTENVDITTTGQLLTSSTATRATTITITANGALIVSKTATVSVAVGLTSSGVLLLSKQADRVETVTLTATGLFTGSSTASQDSTVGITAVGSLILFGAASMNLTADITPIGSGGLRYTYRDTGLGTTPRPDTGTTPRVLAGATYRV